MITKIQFICLFLQAAENRSMEDLKKLSKVAHGQWGASEAEVLVTECFALVANHDPDTTSWLDFWFEEVEDPWG